jgi:N-acyl-D-amino-acid deacylase
VGLDTSVDDYKHEQKAAPWGVPGISQYSAYVGFFDKFVKRQKALILEEAVYKTSTLVAKRHNLKGRGIIAEGSYADIVLIDFENLMVTGTPLEPRRQPRGVEYVFVNGVAVVKNAKHTGATPGRVLRRE